MSDATMPYVCRSCRAPLDEVVLDLGERPDLDDFRSAGEAGLPTPRARLDLRRCRTCSLVQLGAPGVPPRGPHGHGALYSSSTASHLTGWSESLLASGIVRPGDRALDIAAGAGQLLRPLREAGVTVVGIEPDAELLALAREHGVDVRLGSYDAEAAAALNAAGPRFDLVLLDHTLAHATDLAAMIASVEAVLTADGSVALEMHHLLELVRLGQFELITPAHVAYLSLIALEPLLGAHGLVAVSAEASANYGGTVRLLIRRRDVARTGPTVTALLEVERAAGLDQPAGFADLATRMRETVGSVQAHLQQAAAEGRSVVGYGAPARGAMLLDMAGATPALLPFTVDRSPAKQGRLLAGSDIPILDPIVLERQRPDEILILPWPLRDEIAGQLAALHDAGTRFSVALPAWATW